jgi:uncharacterized glyoxalase superfamily protein PhnB
MATRRKSTKPRKQQISPYLLYRDVGKALKWLTKAFGFTEIDERYTGKDGTIQHSAMRIEMGGDVFMLGCPGKRYKNPKQVGGVTQMQHIMIRNVDAHYTRAKKAGARILAKPEDTFYGHRRYGAEDPEGHQWYFAEELLKPAAKGRKNPELRKRS